MKCRYLFANGISIANYSNKDLSSLLFQDYEATVNFVLKIRDLMKNYHLNHISLNDIKLGNVFVSTEPFYKIYFGSFEFQHIHYLQGFDI